MTLVSLGLLPPLVPRRTGCSLISTDLVGCPDGGITGVVVHGGDQDDTVTLEKGGDPFPTGVEVAVFGGDGSDAVSGSHLGDQILGEGGDGRQLKFLNIVDEFTREALEMRCERTIDADETVAALERIVSARGIAPENLRADNGPELTARVLREWCVASSTATAYIDPGSPWQNPWIESFNARVRDEHLDVEEFSSLVEAQVLTEDFRLDYNADHPHSALGMMSPEKPTNQSTPNSQKGWTDERGPVSRLPAVGRISLATAIAMLLFAWAASASETPPPDTTVTSGPTGTVAHGSPATFSFTSSGADLTFECRFDGWANWQSCASPSTFASLNAGDRTFSVRATDAAGNDDPTPATRSFTVDTSPSSGSPPPGTIVQADYMTRACPIDNLWGAVSDAYFYAQSCSSWANDPQIDYSSTGGSPVPAQDGQVHPGYRRLSLTNGMQSLYDAGVNNTSYRTQLISNSDTGTYYPMQPGHRYVWWISVRFQNPTPLTGDGVDNDSQVWQIKDTGSCAGPDEVGPIESMSETKNTILLKERQQDGEVRVDSFPIGERGVWQTFALDVLYSNDPSKAAYRLWADQDGDSTLDLVPLTPKITGRVTAVGPSCIGKPSIGPYEPMSLPAVSRDYGVNEMVEVPVDAPWQ